MNTMRYSLLRKGNVSHQVSPHTLSMSSTRPSRLLSFRPLPPHFHARTSGNTLRKTRYVPTCLDITDLTEYRRYTVESTRKDKIAELRKQIIETSDRVVQLQKIVGLESLEHVRKMYQDLRGDLESDLTPLLDSHWVKGTYRPTKPNHTISERQIALRKRSMILFAQSPRYFELTSLLNEALHERGKLCKRFQYVIQKSQCVGEENNLPLLSAKRNRDDPLLNEFLRLRSCVSHLGRNRSAAIPTSDHFHERRKQDLQRRAGISKVATAVLECGLDLEKYGFSEAGVHSRSWALLMRNSDLYIPSTSPTTGIRRTARQVRVLAEWYLECLAQPEPYPYPSEEDKDMLSEKSNLTRESVNLWFIKVRKVRKKHEQVLSQAGIPFQAIAHRFGLQRGRPKRKLQARGNTAGNVKGQGTRIRRRR